MKFSLPHIFVFTILHSIVPDTLVSPNPKGFKRSGVVDLDNKTRGLRGQEGMVDAGANGLNCAQRSPW